MFNRAAPMVPMQPGQPPQSSPALSHRAWQTSQLQRHLRELEDNLCLLKAVKDEIGVLLSLEGTLETDFILETEMPSLQDSSPCSVASLQQTQVRSLDRGNQSVMDDGHKIADEAKNFTPDTKCSETTKDPLGLELLRTVLLDAVEKPARSMEIDGRRLAVTCAARSVCRHVRSLLAPFELVSSAIRGLDKSGMVARIAKKRLKVKRNRKWRSKRRQQAAIALQKEKAEFEELDAQADALRAREIAKDLSMRKMEHMKAIAEQKAKEDRLRRVQEQEMGLLVEKLHELRSLRIQKLKKQGKFFPDEDNEFLERIRLAVEEEERQASAAADTSAAATAIANASVTAKSAPSAFATKVSKGAESEGLLEERDEIKEQDQFTGMADSFSRSQFTVKQGLGGDQQDTSESFQYRSLPPEFYHYYYGSSFDMGTLIEVRCSWDAFIVPAGGSRIPGHWVQAPVPADAVWASYLVTPTMDLSYTDP